jgi:NTE family protein
MQKTALVLSGGGARGAYEVGVLSYIFDDLARLRGSPPRIDILSGTSVGAINACFLAAHMSHPTDGVRRLERLWRNIKLDEILGFGWRQAIGVPKVLRGGGTDGAGFFDVSPITDLVQKEIPWRSIARSLRHRRLEVLSISTTEVRSGRTVIFMQMGPEGALPSTTPPRTVIRGDLIGPPHALASAAIPLVFPAVRIGRELYVDGGLRQNTPIAPALRMGATHILAIGLSQEVRGIPTDETFQGTTPGASFLLGKVLNAFLLDHIDSDLEGLARLNNVIRDGEKAYGPDFTKKINEFSKQRGGQPLRHVETFAIHPSTDLGLLAADHLRHRKLAGGTLITRRLLKLLDSGEGPHADLSSYLLFDGTYASRLIDLGRADAAARRDELLEFFRTADMAPDEGGPPSGTAWTIPPPILG